VATASRCRTTSDVEDHPEDDTHRVSISRGFRSEDVYVLDYDCGSAAVQVRRGRKVAEFDVYSDCGDGGHDGKVSEQVRRVVRQRLFMYAKRRARLPEPVYYVPGRYDHEIDALGEELGFGLEVVGEVPTRGLF
jgi:hypothetical protein